MFQRILILGCALAVAFAAPALAGKNNGGAMLVHTNDTIVYTASANYCNSTLPATCEEFGTRTDRAVEEEVAVIWCLAAFAPGTTPAVTTVQFGLDHNLPDSPEYFVKKVACGPSPLELPDADWPQGGGDGQTGNLVTFATPVTGQIFPFYVFAVYGSLPNSYFATRSYPSTGEAKFVDDNQPPIEDVVTRFGTVRWGAAGENNCPVPPATGACCTPWATCVIRNQSDCESTTGEFQPGGGSYLGDNTTCPPQPNCGACCYWSGEVRACKVTDINLCNQLAGGDFSYGGSRCTNASQPESVAVAWYCGEIPSKVNSWGVLKSLFR